MATKEILLLMTSQPHQASVVQKVTDSGKLKTDNQTTSNML